MSRHLVMRGGLVLLALIAAGVVALWGASQGANALVFLPVAALLAALLTLMVSGDPVVHRIATLAAVLITLVVAVIASASVGWFLLPAVLLAAVSVVLPARNGDAPPSPSR